MATYKRQRLVQYFEQKPMKRSKTHSPSTQNWDTLGLISNLESLPAGTKIIWQQLAEKHGIVGPNRGQVCKEYVIKNSSVDLARFTYGSFHINSTHFLRVVLRIGQNLIYC